jgi:hypothetical protein
MHKKGLTQSQLLFSSIPKTIDSENIPHFHCSLTEVLRLPVGEFQQSISAIIDTPFLHWRKYD